MSCLHAGETEPNVTRAESVMHLLVAELKKVRAVANALAL